SSGLRQPRGPRPPPDRGCSSRRPSPGPGRGPPPRPRGVLRRAQSARHHSARPPRRRGCVPTCPEFVMATIESSPPTRGCSGAPPPARRAGPVLPADAGVFRFQITPATAITGPPRRGGGVPIPGPIAKALGMSSPPTRGCSARGALHGDDLAVLPADARGWSAARADHPRPVPVLPADAGVSGHVAVCGVCSVGGVAQSSPRAASAASLSAVSLVRRLLRLDRNTPSLTTCSTPSTTTVSSCPLEGVREPVRALY